MRAFNRVILALLLTVALVTVPQAQTATTVTTLSAAVNNSQNVFTLTSGTGVIAGWQLYVDRELMTVQSISSATVTVTRGQGGTLAAAHGIKAPVYLGLPNQFDRTAVVGPCVSTSNVALPHINVQTGDVYDCASSFWVRRASAGFEVSPFPLAAQGGSGMTYTANGAITIQPGTQFLNGSGLAMTLADPTTAQNGTVMVILATDATAKTITYTAGFNGGTTARDVATFGGAIGDNLVIIANNGVWWVISTRNVTLA
jgi:hypothetical protein